MVTIHKYDLTASDVSVITMPRGARVLSVQTQRGRPMIWALVETEAPSTQRSFAVRGTGHPCGGLEDATFVGTFQLQEGALVFHLFDLGEERE